MLSYHNDPAVKFKYQERFARHRELDSVIQGTGYDSEAGRGCFVGCTLENYDHSRFPTELGWPEWLAHLADKIFEGVPSAEAPQFGTDLLEAVPVGVDLEPVRALFLIAVHRRNLARLDGNTEPYAEQCRQAIQKVIDWLEGGAQENTAAWSAWSAAESAAESAAVSAAWSAESAAESAAELAAESAAESAWSAWSAARSAESQQQRDDLLTILKGLK